MKTLAKYALAAFLAGGAAVATTAPASAEVGITFGFGSPGYYGGYGSYNSGRPCWFYRRWDLPAPARCYRDYYGTYGADTYFDRGYVYRDRDDYNRWDHRGWHDRGRWGGGDWHDHDRRGDWGGDRDHDRGDWHGGGDGDHHDGGHWHDRDRR